jgi:transcription elongation factor GreA
VDEERHNLKMLALTGQYDELEDAWLEAMEGGVDPDQTQQTLKVLVERKEAERARVLGGMVLSPLVDREFFAEAVETARLIAPLPGDEDPEIADILLTAFARVYADRAETESLLRKALVYRRQGLAVLLRNIDAMFQFRQGDIVHHGGGWGYGRVEKITARREELTVVFRSGRRNHFPVLTAGEYLRRIDPEGFEGLRFADPEKLRTMAESDPLELLKLLLLSHNRRIQVKHLKDVLSPDVVETGRWSGWWSRVRGKLKYNAYFEIEAGSNPWIRLLEQPESFGDAALREFESLASFSERFRRARAYLSEARGRIDAEVLTRMVERLCRDTEAGEAISPEDRAGLWFLHLRAREKGFKPPGPSYALEEVVKDSATFLRAIKGLRAAADQTALLDFVSRTFPEDWPEWFVQTYFLPELSVWDRVTKTLLEHGHRERVTRAFTEVCMFPKKAPLTFLWIFRSRLAGRFEELPGLPGILEMTEKALPLTNRLKMADQLSRGADVRRVFEKAREILTERHFRSLFDSITATDAMRLIDLISVSGLKRSFTEVIEQIGISKFPEIVTKDKAEEAGPDPRYLWVTEEGLRSRRAEYDHLINVEVEKNRVALGKALAMGDLSENAELDAAREMQAQLSRKANQLESELDRARTIDFSAVSAEEVTVGAGIEVRGADGQTQRFYILGPWDTDTDLGRISYTAPLGKAFLGKRPGDRVRVVLPDGERIYTLESIFPYRESDSPERVPEEQA